MTVRPSRARSLLVALLGAGAVRALALCALPAPLFVLAAGGTLAFTARELARERRRRRLHVDANGPWRLATAGGERFVGRPSGRGHRSAALIVVELVDERVAAPRARTDSSGGSRSPVRRVLRAIVRRRRRRHVAVFADSVGARDFSFLQLALALPAAAR